MKNLQTCKDKYWIRNFFNITINEDMICTFNSNNETSQGTPLRGDSGGPLIYVEDPHFVIHGISSFVLWSCDDRDINCLEKHCTQLPDGTFFTRVTSYLDWIIKRMDDYNPCNV